MTREEGLDWLYRLRSEIYVYMPKEWLIPMNNALDMAISALSENKGEWERVSGGSLIDIYRCSKCKHEPTKKPLPERKTWGWNFTGFCPNCGADMRPEPYKPKNEKGGRT